MYVNQKFKKGRNKINNQDVFYNSTVPEIYEQAIFEKK